MSQQVKLEKVVEMSLLKEIQLIIYFCKVLGFLFERFIGNNIEVLVNISFSYMGVVLKVEIFYFNYSIKRYFIYYL